MKPEEIVKAAESFIGKSRDEVNCSGSHAWCANFVSEILKRCDIELYDLSCTSMQRRMSQSEDWDEPENYPQPGDVIFFDWDHINESRPLDHVGIVTKFKDYVVTYVNGNGSSSEYVTEQQISVDSPCVAYWMRYIGDRGNKPPDSDTFSVTIRTLSKGMKGNDVKSLQRLLIADGYSVGVYGDDGDFGNATEKAVVRFQEEHKELEADGVVGLKTFTKLWKG